MIVNDSIKRQIRICKQIISLVLLLSVAYGFTVAINNPESSDPFVRRTLGQYSFIRGLNLFAIFLFIFFNNTVKALLVLIMGTILGISPLIFIFINGQLIGLVIGVSSQPLKVILEIAPHGILEIPAIVLAASYGLWLGFRLFRFFRYREPFEIYFMFALKKYFKVILPMLFVAALIETFITPLVIAILAK